ncbi:MAG TPA: hypothetical protein VGR61_08720 [Candidatus Dormibacteraeota bacterium]|nr:hypothetical protein [Candidatus Dormibacteraeota bacterium]
MAPITPAYRMRPLDVGDVLDEAFRIYRANFPLMIAVALVASIPALVAGIGSGQGGAFGALQQYAALSQGNNFVRPDTTLLPLTFIGFLLGIVMFPITTGAPVFAACAVTLGLPATLGSILRDCLHNYWRVWGIGFLYGLVTASFILIISFPFVVWLLVRWSFRYQVLYLEHARVGGSLNRSTTLVKGSWWRVFGILILVFVILFVLGLILQGMFGLLSLLAPAGLVRQAAGGVLSALTQAVLLPFGAIAVTLLYLDQRVRRESLDLQLMAGQAGQVAALPAPARAVELPPGGGLPPAWSDLPPPSAG